MGTDKRLGYAFAASLLVNAGCVALVGAAARHHPAGERGRDTSSLHPIPINLADPGRLRLARSDTPGTTGDGTGSAAGDAGTADSPDTAPGQNKVPDRRKGSPARGFDERAPGKTGHVPMPTGAPARRSAQAPRRSPAALHRAGTRGHAGPTRPRTGFSVVTKPSIPGRNGHAGAPGNAIAPKMVRYPRQKLDLGTIHMTRPTHGVTGGGSADLRQVAIKVHYVVDDPGNIPKTLAPDKILRLFPTNCNGDPGNTSKCLPTGGNTRLGGTVLHGRHDQITGVKYCLPGGGGIPAGGSGGSPSGAAADPSGKAGRIVSQVYHGWGPTTSSGTTPGDQGGLLNTAETVALVTHASHLPATHGDFRGQTPGARVPEADRRWVADPVAHAQAAPQGAQTPPLPRFRVAVRSVGSLSRFGTVDWGKPAKARRRTAPPGGDGSGLLGLYYHGNDFQTLAFTRPDRDIDFDWSAGPPDPRIAPGTEYSVRWIGELVPPTTDTYTLMVTSDDGARLYLGGRLLIADWTTHSPSEDTATVRLEAGRHYSLKLEYYENSIPPAAIKLYWEAPSVPRQYVPEQCLRYPITQP